MLCYVVLCLVMLCYVTLYYVYCCLTGTIKPKQGQKLFFLPYDVDKLLRQVGLRFEFSDGLC